MKKLVIIFTIIAGFACGRSDIDPDTGPADYPTPDTRIVDNGGEFGYQVGEYISFKFHNNIPHISYYDRTNGDLRYATINTSRANRPWLIEVPDQGLIGDTDADVGEFTDIAIDVFNQPHISYYDKTNKMLKYAVKNGSEWEIYIIDGGSGKIPIGTWSSIALDENGVAHFAYIDENQHNLKHALFDSNHPDDDPIISVVDTGLGDSDGSGSGGNLGPDTDMTLIPGQLVEFPIISYYDASNGHLKVAFYDNAARQWRLDTVAKSIFGESISFSPTPPHIGTVRHDMVQNYGSTQLQGGKRVLTAEEFIFEGSRTLIVNNSVFDEVNDGNNKHWNVSYARDDIRGSLSPIANAGKWNSIFVDNIGRRHFSFAEENNDDLMYAQDTGVIWIIETVASEGVVGAHSSIAVAGPANDPQLQQPIISYFDATNNDMMLAYRRAENDWDLFRLDTAYMSGTWSSIDVTNDGLSVGVAYHDPQKDWLKFAFVNYF